MELECNAFTGRCCSIKSISSSTSCSRYLLGSDVCSQVDEIVRGTCGNASPLQSMVPYSKTHLHLPIHDRNVSDLVVFISWPTHRTVPTIRLSPT
uniref:Uncharacterized protein n=1 Tax=Spodoptera frugiperda ascovirus 1a TaxID=113370 RepID=Q9DKL7_SFAVA|nr:hypothetical protein [Spodoptera frugiperda ascovirus 1a]